MVLRNRRPPPGRGPDDAVRSSDAWDASGRAQIFEDPRKRRRRLVVAFFAAIATAIVVWFILFAMNLYVVDKLPGAALIAPNGPRDVSVSAAPAEDGLRGGLNPSECASSPYPPLAPTDHVAGTIRLPTDRVWAFLPYLPENAYTSLRAGVRHIDTLLAEWFRIGAADGKLAMLNRATEAQGYAAQIIARERGRMNLAPVATLEAGALALDETGQIQRSLLARDIAQAAEREGAQGFCLMPMGLKPEETAAFSDLLVRMDAALNARGLVSCLVTGADDGLLIDDEFDDAVDRVVLKAFAQPWIGDPPGPLAATAQFRADVEAAIETVGRGRLVVMLGSFATDWSRGVAAPEAISVAEAMARVSRAGGSLDFPEAAGNLRMRYDDNAGRAHEIWVLDAVTIYNQMLILSDLEMRRVGLWALGTQDPSAWPLFAARNVTPDLAELYIGRIDLSDFVSYIGAGPFHELIVRARPGLRHIRFAEDGRTAIAEGCAPFPSPAVIRRFGKVSPDMVAITFDDGPDAKYTTEILDLLKARDVRATFFVVGSKVLGTPDLVRRMYDEGHEIGSHTFLHPSLETVPDWRTKLELNAMQRLLVAVTGHGTVLFRAPYGRGEGPITGRSAAPMTLIEDGGYVIVGSDVVPPDWQGIDATGIADHAMNWLATEGGNVIVLHDGGGDRSATVEALGQLIDRLRADGYRIVPLAEMLGVTRDDIMPFETGPGYMLDRASFGLMGISFEALSAVFWVIVLVGVARSLGVLVLAHLRRRHDAPAAADGPTPPVTVLIPAFNEEETILRCLASVFASDYPDIRVIVIDDGSTDHTFATVATVAAHEPRLRLIHEANSGKWAALDMAYTALETEIVVAIDADSMIAHDAISAMVRHFDDPDVGAVAGRVQVGNRMGLLTRLQALEYLTAQSIDRRAAEHLNAMLVVPGAIGAWRAEAVRKAGLYSPQTVTEDADLTVAVIRAGYRVVYEEGAYAVTEAPETVRGLMGQRLRWSFGMLQTGFKHLGGAIRQRKAVGFVTLPDLMLVGFGLAALAPLADLILLSALFDLTVNLVLGRPEPIGGAHLGILLGYAALPLFDVVIILCALRFDRSESRWMLLLIPFQRFFYRQLLYITAWRAMIRALLGKLASWGKLARTGTARMPGQGPGATGENTSGKPVTQVAE